MDFPFEEEQIDQYNFIRTFPADVDEMDLIWHADKENRIITVTALRALKTVKSIKNKSDVKSAESKVVSLQNSGSENIALSKPYIQVGIFSIEQNARNTAEVMHQLNIQPTVKEQTSRNKTFWRVIVGPAVDMNERSTLLQKVKAVGFGDAYAVSK